MRTQSGDSFAMSAVEFRECVKAVVRAEKARCGSLPNARKAIAYRQKIAPGTLYNGERGRLKKVSGDLIAAVFNEIQRECASWEYRLQILKQMGAGLTSADMQQAMTHLQALRSMLAR